MKTRFFLSLILSAAALNAWSQRIAVLSDTHVSPGNASEQRLREAVAEINAGAYDLVVVNGDLSNEGSDAELRNVKAILDGVRHPLVVLPGNHENNWSQSATKTFVDLWGTDRFATTIDSLVVIGINCGPYMKMGDGHIKQEDLHWLKSSLDSMATPGRRVLSFNHYPLLDDLDNCADYLAVLENYPVIAHVNGHYHSWRTYSAGGDASGSDLPCVMTRALNMRDGSYGYADIEVDKDWVRVYNKELGRAREAKFAFPARSIHTAAVFPPRPAVDVPAGFEVEKLWADSASIFTRLGFDKHNVYFGNSLGYARAVGKADGALKWSTPLGASLFSRPQVLTSGRVAVPAHDGIYILDPRTGKLHKRIASEEGPYVADGLVTADGKAYLQGGYKRMERRRPSDGRLVWVYDSLFNYCQGAPAVDGDEIVFGAWDTNLRSLDMRDGKLNWVWNNGKANNMLGPGNVVPVISADKVFIVAPDRYMTAIARADGSTLWRNNSHRFRESLGRSEDGKRVYAKTMDGELVAVDATAPDYRELWTVGLGIGYDHAPCIVLEKNGVVYAGSRRGVLTLTDAAYGHLIASLPLGVSEINGIDMDPSTGDVYVSLIEGTIFRISRTDDGR
ncbi:MAG: PQQ-binding-like beta-propeller repeat protein [Muribaculaceae bacterium]|nr:PQQ-binding-like beta-propeller repeat protein [Muribaculaceae bacterium]